MVIRIALQNHFSPVIPFRKHEGAGANGMILHRARDTWSPLRVPFDGLYGQDAYAYLDYAGALRTALLNGSPPPPFFWPIGYPLHIVAFSWLTTRFDTLARSTPAVKSAAIHTGTESRKTPAQTATARTTDRMTSRTSMGHLRSAEMRATTSEVFIPSEIFIPT